MRIFNSESFRINLLKAIAPVLSLVFVFTSLKLFSLETFTKIQVDYTIYIFLQLVFSLGLFPLCQLVANKHINLVNELYLVIIIKIVI